MWTPEARSSCSRINRALFEQSIDFDFAARGEIDTAVHNDWDHESRRVCGAVTRGVLLGREERVAHLSCVESVEDGFLLGPFHVFVAMAQRTPSFVPFAEIVGVAPGLSKCVVEAAAASTSWPLT